MNRKGYVAIFIALMNLCGGAEVPTVVNGVAQSAEDEAKLRGSCAYPCADSSGCCFACSGCCLSCPVSVPCCISKVTCPVCSMNANTTYIKHGELVGPGMSVQV
eukprot:TRINITY_DN5694_c0_g3_i1.p1 TRINITY_DN5694_c0_g3~~TRINITY_DN5694_c0_g3_i1.p1  ORF type:complete len:104 (+),score=12.25 TRINITY_DN5694_c0_g3_i1:77-388(+)